MDVPFAAAQGYLVWEASDGKLSILVPRQLLAQLKDFASREAGAVLLGHAERMEASGRRVVTIESFESGISRLYDPAVVGFVRCRKQTALHLADADFRILKDAPDMVCLMIRPDDAGGAIGGFFYREGRTVHCPPPALQFPISPDALDCNGVLCVKERPRAAALPAAAMGQAAAAAVEEDAPQRSPVKRLLYAVAGIALLLSPYVIWRAMQHDSGSVAPPGQSAAPAGQSAAPAPVTPASSAAPAPVQPPLVTPSTPRPAHKTPAHKTQAPKRLANHGRLRHARNLTKHVR